MVFSACSQFTWSSDQLQEKVCSQGLQTVGKCKRATETAPGVGVFICSEQIHESDVEVRYRIDNNDADRSYAQMERSEELHSTSLR